MRSRKPGRSSGLPSSLLSFASSSLPRRKNPRRAAAGRKRAGARRGRRPSQLERLEDRLALAATTIELPGVAPEYTTYVQSGEYLPIYTNPADRLVNSDVKGDGVPIVLGEWGADGNLDGWNVKNVAGSSVSSGVLSLTLREDSGGNPAIELKNLSDEPNLNFGFNDYLQVRMKLPVGYNQPVSFRYGTTGGGNDGFSGEREFQLPAAELIADGEFHTYRFDLGLEVWWRDKLDDLRISFPETGFEGETVEIDYVEVGDQPGDALLLNSDIKLDNTTGVQIVAAGDLTHAESKHAAIWWSPSQTPGFDSAAHEINGLRQMEEAYQYFLKVMGYGEPFLENGNVVGQAPPAIEEGFAELNFYGELPQDVALEEAVITIPFTSGGFQYDVVATLDGIENSLDGGVNRNGNGVHPVAPNFVSGGDKNDWVANEEFVLSYRIVDGDGGDVTADFEVELTDVTATWKNDVHDTMVFTVGNDPGSPLGALEFEDRPGGPFGPQETLAFETPVNITEFADGVLLDILPVSGNRFQFRSIGANVFPVGSSGSDGGGSDSPADPEPGPPLPSPLPDYSLERYKTNATTWVDTPGAAGVQGNYKGFQGIAAGPQHYLNPQTGVVVHEYAHTVQDAMPGGVGKTGVHETHADYLKERWNYYFQETFSSQNKVTNLSERILTNSNFRQDHHRFFYQDDRIHFALQDHYGEFGLPSNTQALLWQIGPQGQSFYEALELVLSSDETPAGLSVADVIAGSLKHWATLDFDYGDIMREDYYNSPAEKARFDHRNGSLLIESPDAPGWLRVPLERAPEKYAFMTHDFVPTGSTVTVEFSGIDVMGEGEDWRWTLVAIDDDGNGRYSDTWAPGTQSLDLLPGENLVRMMVVATPEDLSTDTQSFFNTKPSDKHIDRLRYPYEVRVEGMEQASKQLAYTPSSSGAFHVNPDGTTGGWVDSTASVAATAYVGPNAMVLGSAEVKSNARIEDYAVVANNAEVRGNAVVSGFAAVINSAIVENDARVTDRAIIQDSGRISGRGVVEDYAIIRGNGRVRGDAIARGSVEQYSGIAQGTAILDYDYSMGWTFNDGVHQSHVGSRSWFNDYFYQTQTKPEGLIASYRAEAPGGDVLWDEFGAQHGWLRGGAERVLDIGATGEVIQLNGVDQHLLLDRSVVDVREGSFGVWIKPDAAESQTVLYAGDQQGGALELSLDGSGVPVLGISVGGQSTQVTAPAPVAAGEWTHLAFTFGGGQMRLYVDGQLAGQQATPLTPSDVLGANDYQSAEMVYVGRNAAGDQFAGRVDDIRFYNVTRSAAEVQAEMDRRGAVLGQFFVDTPQNFGSAGNRQESGVRNGIERTLSASIKPDSSPNTSYYQAVLDSNDERSGAFKGSGFGLDDGQFVVRLDGLGMWNTGVEATIGEWQDVTVGFNGTDAYLYIDGQLEAQRTYTANPEQIAGKNYRIGFGQADNDAYTDFDGQIQNVQILDQMLLPGQALPGDYNSDGVVGAADFVVWRGSLGESVTPGTGADAVADGVIDIGDYLAWQENFGATAVTPAEITAATAATNAPASVTALAPAAMAALFAAPAPAAGPLPADASAAAPSGAAPAAREAALLLLADAPQAPVQDDHATPAAADLSLDPDSAKSPDETAASFDEALEEFPG